tara:strand:+ start:1014 stop:1190 length:177 start_codon:yes stop_codon:yes gene_type:complete
MIKQSELPEGIEKAIQLLIRIIVNHKPDTNQQLEIIREIGKLRDDIVYEKQRRIDEKQ